MIRDAQIIYPIYMELSKRCHLGIIPCSELESVPAQVSSDALVRVERWLRTADTHIEVHHLREVLGRITVTGEALHALLAWHLGKEPKDKSDRNKIDFLLVQHLAECLPSNIPVHDLSFEQVAEILKPLLGETMTHKRVPGLEDCIRDMARCRTLGDFVEHWVVERGHALKVAAQEKPFDPTTLAAFTQFSFLLRLSSIRVLREDIQTLQDDLKELENRGVTKIDIDDVSGNSSEKQSIGELRNCCEEWKRYFPEKYTQNQWFTDVIWLRSHVKKALEASTGRSRTESSQVLATGITNQESATPDSSESAHREAANSARLQAEVERYMQEVASQLQSPIRVRVTSVTAVELSGLRLMLSSGEVEAFQETGKGMNVALQHAVAVRAVLLAALNNAIDVRAAVNLAESEAIVLQEQITAAKEMGDTEQAVNLTACYRSLRKVLEKMDKALLTCPGENLRTPEQQKRQTTAVEQS